MNEYKITTYSFKELNKEAKEAAIEECENINECAGFGKKLHIEAKKIGLKLLDQFGEEGELLFKHETVIKKILKKYNKQHKLYAIAKKFETKFKKNDLYRYRVDFVKELCSFFRQNLKKEERKLFTKKAVIDTINYLDLEFTYTGKRFYKYDYINLYS